MRPFAALLVMSLLLGTPRDARGQDVPAPADAASAALEARAQALYQEGREHFRAGRFEEARASFLASLERFDSPNTRMYLGRSLARLGRAAEAYSMLDRAARDAEARARAEPRYDATRANARAEADALRASLGWLRVYADPAPADLTVALDDGPAQRGVTGVELPLSPGAVRVVARARGYEPEGAAVEVVVGEVRDVRLTLRPVSAAAADGGVASARENGPVTLALTRRGPVRTAGVVTGVAGLLSLATGLAFGLVAWDQYQSVLTEPSQRDLALDGIRNRDAANSLLGVGGVLTAVGALLYSLAPARAEAAPAPRVLVGPGGVGLSGRF